MAARSGYTLLDGEKQHARAPQTFSIPSRAERMSLRAGDVVKLSFRAKKHPRGESGVERMWVLVGRTETPGHYVGQLRNEPLGPMGGLQWGSLVAFDARHVIDIEPRRASRWLWLLGGAAILGGVVYLATRPAPAPLPVGP